MPARMIRSQSLFPKELTEKLLNFFKKKLTTTRKTAMITALIVVARVESISLRPNLAKMATKAAVIAESKANNNHILKSLPHFAEPGNGV
jgi:hypothetical protein